MVYPTYEINLIFSYMTRKGNGNLKACVYSAFNIVRLLRAKENIIPLPSNTGIYRTPKYLFKETSTENAYDTYRALNPS